MKNNFYFFAALCKKETTCSNHGTCGNDGECICHVNYFGPDCKSKCNFAVSIFVKSINDNVVLFMIFFSISAAFCNPKTTCNDKGSCDEYGKCKCDDAYFGNKCTSECN